MGGEHKKNNYNIEIYKKLYKFAKEREISESTSLNFPNNMKTIINNKLIYSDKNLDNKLEFKCFKSPIININTKIKNKEFRLTTELYNNHIMSNTPKVEINTKFLVLDGIEWLYTTTESILAYNFKIWYLFNDIFIFNDNFDFFFNYIWVLSLYATTLQLFYSILLDNYIINLVSNNYFNNDWIRALMHSKENTLIWLYHPELIWYIKSINIFYIKHFSSAQNFIYLNKNNVDLLISTHTLFLQLILFILIFSSFITILFNYYSNANIEENTIDADYLSMSGTVEAEKEISSIDDYLGLVFTITYIFGSFFYVHAWTITMAISSLIVSYYSILIMFIFVLGMPTLILYDLGIFFLTYLKGAGKQPNMFIEVIFDYIACIVFYTRIIAQWVRIVLMLITFLSLSHYVAEFEITNAVLIGNENQVDNMNELDLNRSFTYYIITILPGKLLYWIYEIIHTIFLVSSQFIAFFAIVFWLFLFLYTFFIIEKHEDFFSKKRELRKIKLKKLYNLKN